MKTNFIPVIHRSLGMCKKIEPTQISDRMMKISITVFFKYQDTDELVRNLKLLTHRMFIETAPREEDQDHIKTSVFGRIRLLQWSFCGLHLPCTSETTKHR